VWDIDEGFMNAKTNGAIDITCGRNVTYEEALDIQDASGSGSDYKTLSSMGKLNDNGQ
jgi:hypothetical protein